MRRSAGAGSAGPGPCAGSVGHLGSVGGRTCCRLIGRLGGPLRGAVPLGARARSRSTPISVRAASRADRGDGDRGARGWQTVPGVRRVQRRGRCSSGLPPPVRSRWSAVPSHDPPDPGGDPRTVRPAARRSPRGHDTPFAAYGHFFPPPATLPERGRLGHGAGEGAPSGPVSDSWSCRLDRALQPGLDLLAVADVADGATVLHRDGDGDLVARGPPGVDLLTMTAGTAWWARGRRHRSRRGGTAGSAGALLAAGAGAATVWRPGRTASSPRTAPLPSAATTTSVRTGAEDFMVSSQRLSPECSPTRARSEPDMPGQAARSARSRDLRRPRRA